MLKDISKTLTDSISFSEVIGVITNYVMTLTDSLSLTESFLKAISKAKSESISLSESLLRATAKAMSDLITPLSDIDQAIDLHSSNWLDLGGLGNLGSHTNTGLHIEFDIKTTQTTNGGWGMIDQPPYQSACCIFFNTDGNGNAANHKICLYFVDNLNSLHYFYAGTTNVTNFNDGNWHHIAIDVASLGTTPVVTITIDGQSQPITYKNKQAIALGDFTNGFCIGAVSHFYGAHYDFFTCQVNNFKIGTSSSNLYANLPFDDGANPTADITGNGNNGTFAGTPSFVLLLNPLQKAIGKFPAHSVSLIESLLKSASRTITESITLTESFIKAIVKSFNETTPASTIDSYSETNYNQDYYLSSADYLRVGQAFTGNGEKLGSCKFYLKKGNGNPYGNAVAKLYALSGNFGTDALPIGDALAVSNTFAVSDLTSDFQLITFVFDGTFTLVNGTHYFIVFEYLDGDFNNDVIIGNQGWDSLYPGNDAIDNGGWFTDGPGATIIFYVYGVSSGLSLVETFTKAMTKPFAESITLTETFIRGMGTFYRTLVDVVTPQETLIKAVAKTLHDSLSFSEVITKIVHYVMTLTDAITPNELFQKAVNKAYSESVSLSESFQKIMAKGLRDAITLTEVLKKLFHVFGQKATRVRSGLFTFAGKLFQKKSGDLYH